MSFWTRFIIILTIKILGLIKGASLSLRLEEATNLSWRWTILTDDTQFDFTVNYATWLIHGKLGIFATHGTIALWLITYLLFLILIKILRLDNINLWRCNLLYYAFRERVLSNLLGLRLNFLIIN